MKLILVRHGEDICRKLSPNGQNQVRRLAAAVTKAGFVPSVLLSSELERASQSAALLSEEFAKVSGGAPLTVQNLAGLNDNAWPLGFLRDLPTIVTDDPVVIAVTHMPIVKEIAFVSGHEFPAGEIGNAEGVVLEVKREKPIPPTFLQAIAPEVS